MPTTFNPADLSGVTLTGANLIATSTAQGGVRATNPQSRGKFYFEFTIGATFAHSNSAVGVANGAAVLSSAAPTPANCFVIYRSGTIWLNNVTTGLTLGVLTAGTVVCAAIDWDGGLGWFRLGAAGNWNGAGTANPATGTQGINIAAITSGQSMYA